MQGAQVRSLGGELRSRMLRGAARKKKTTMNVASQGFLVTSSYKPMGGAALIPSWRKMTRREFK